MSLRENREKQAYPDFIRWNAKQTLEALSLIPYIGAKAGTTLRRTISTLLENKGQMPEILDKYSIDYNKVDPRNNSFNNIVRVFSEKN